MIDQYFSIIEESIEKCSLITSKTLTFSKYTDTIGYIKGTLIFWNETELHFREYLDLEANPSKLDYSYHYQKGNALIFRYDNTPHYPLIATFPHHKHEGTDEKNVLASQEPAFENILQEILHLLSS